MASLAAIVIPVRADLAAFAGQMRSGLTAAMHQAEPSVRQGARTHGGLFGRLFSSEASNGISRGIGPSLGKVGGQFTEFAGVATGALGVTTAGVGALAGAALVMGTKTAASMEQAQIGFATLLGSGTKAQAFLSQLQTFAAATPFELPGLIDSSRLLLGVGVSAKDTMTILQSFGNASSAVGVGQENFQRIMLATSQAIGAGRFMTQDLNQITENGIPIWTILSRAMGKPVPVLRTLASQGKLLSSDVLPVLERQMNRDYGGAMEKQSRSLNGVWSTFMDTLNIGLANVIRPLIPAMEVGLTGATTVLTAVLSGIPRLFSGTGAAGSGLGTVIRSLAGWVTGSLVPAFQAVAARVLPAARAAIASITAAFHDHQDVVVAVGQVFQGLGWVLTRVLIPAIGVAAVVLYSTLGPAVRLLLTLASAVTAVVRTTITTTVRIGSAISGAFTGAYRAVDNFGTAINTGVTSAVTGAYRVLSGFGAAVNSAITGGFRTAGTWLLGVGRTIVNGLVAGWDAIAPHLSIAAGHTRDLISLAFRAAPSLLLLPGRLIITGLLNGLRAMFGPTTTTVLGFVNQRLLQPFLRSGAWLLVRGQQFVTGLLTGVAQRATAVVAWIQTRVINPATNLFIRSGVWLVARGVQFVSGLLNGVAQRATAIAGWLQARVINPATALFIRSGIWLVARGQQFVSGLLNGIAQRATAVVGWVQSRIITPITSRFAGAIGWLRGAGANVVTGLLGGIGGAIANVRNWVRDHIVNPIIGAVKWFFGIKSPSTVMAGIGGNVMAGFVRGLSLTNMTQLVSRVFGGLPSALSAIVNKGLVALTGLPGKALSALESVGNFIGSGFTGGGGTTGRVGNLNANARIGQSIAASYGWTGPQWGALWNLWQGESGWNQYALNASSGAYGIPQSLPAGKMRAAGADYITNPATQIRWGLDYIKSAYGSPMKAYSMWLGRSPHWYDAGGWLPPGGVGMNLTGRPERVLDPQQSEAYTRGGGAAGGNVRVTVMLDGTVIDDRVHVIVEDAVGELGARIDNGIGG